jgi:hypothetical protein
MEHQMNVLTDHAAVLTWFNTANGKRLTFPREALFKEKGYADTQTPHNPVKAFVDVY